MSADLKRRRELHERHVSPPPTKRKIHSSITSTHDRTGKGVREKRRKVAAFDLDGTLITTISGNKFAKDSTDWKWWHNSVPTALRRLNEDGFQLVVISNQGGISLSKDSKSPKINQKSLSNFKTKIGAIAGQLDMPISVYAATQRDRFRKPRTGIWSEILEYYDLDDGQGPDLEHSFFIGDAGGRATEDGGSDKDFASSDRDFASNAGLTFQTPEEYFLNTRPRPFTRLFEPAVYIEDDSQDASFTRGGTQDVVVFCGSPGAGKSTYYRNNLEPIGYERVNQDILKSREKCLKVAAEHLTNGKSVAVDNTNADEATRASWVELAKRFRVPVRCVLFKADAKLCEHNDAVRALNGAIMNPEQRSMLPKIAFAGFAKRFTAPNLNEGFQDITVVDFRFRGTAEQRRIWSRYHI